MYPMSRLKVLAAGLMAAGGLAGCTPAPTLPTITIDASNYQFAIPDSVAGGLTRVHLINTGTEPHHAQFLRLNDGVTPAQFDSVFGAAMQAAQTEGDVAFFRIFQIADLRGGPASLNPGDSTDVVMDLEPGHYVLMCFLPNAQGVPHVALGMKHFLTVGPAPEPQPVAPTADATIQLADFSFTGADTITAGHFTLEVANQGPEPHEMNIVRLNGLTLAQLRAALTGPPPEGAGPPPFEFVGGSQAMMPGMHEWLDLDLAAGNYALICFVPSPAHNGQPHIALGMIRGLTVR